MNETNQTKVITFNALGKYENLRPTVTPFKASYATMKEMQQLGKLIPGQLYRITDYVTTVNSLTVTNARSAGHQFDILVVAINETTLSEEAWAVPHDGDTYFKDSRLEAWQLKYRLDNEDVTESGKGTITWMKDEWGNEAAYDFKNIQQKRWKVTDELGRSSIDGKYLGVLNNLPEKLSIEDESDFIWAYLYSVYNYAGGTQDTTDHSLTGNVYEMVANFTVDSNNAFVWEDDSYEAYKSTFYGSVRNCSFFGNIQNSIISGQLNNLLINAGNGASGTINGLYTLGKIDGKTITVPTNAAYPTYAAMTTEGQMKTWNPADSLNPIESLGAYDISAAHASGGVLATYADLTAALGTNGANIPEGIRKGGMSVKFVLSSDNKYVQYRLMADAFTTDVTKWAICGDSVYTENPEFNSVELDSEKKILWGIKRDGTFYFGDGCPPQVKEYVLAHTEEIIEELATKVDKVEGKSLSTNDFTNKDKEVVSMTELRESPEFFEVETDEGGRIFGGRKINGNRFENMPVENPVTTESYAEDNPEWIEVFVDINGKIYFGFRKNGTMFSEKIESPTIDVILERLKEQEDPYDILTLNPKRELLPILKNYKFDRGNWAPTDPSLGYKNLSLLWFSDIHSDSSQFKRIMKLYNEYEENFDGIISTGDVVRQTWNDDFTYWAENGGQKILFVNGNHDTYVETANGQKTGKSAKAGYERYIAPYLSYAGYTEPVANKMYWVKDYPESKIRIIALDNMHLYDIVPAELGGGNVYPDGGSVDNGEQIAWLRAKLAETLDENDDAYGYQVICTCHFPAKRSLESIGSINCTFETLWLTTEGGLLQSSLQDEVDTFINNGGTFICWMCGHTHMDEFFLSPHYPNQLCICIDCAQRNLANVGQNDEDIYQSTPKVDGTYSRDSITVFSIEPYLHYIRMYRIGTHYDYYGRKIGSLVYDYINKELIYN